MKFRICIHHLDEGEETEEIITSLQKDEIFPQFDCQRPGWDINEIVITAGTHKDIDKLELLINRLSTNTLKVISDMDLGISLFIDIEPVKSTTKDSSGIMISYDEHSFLSVELMRKLCEKDIGMFINAYGDQDDDIV